ncbi:MAG: hypothetical protein Q4A66_05400 [Eubacteriales bacterium]|nr:hypothetical protein [Eubacteriales bacterium]
MNRKALTQFIAPFYADKDIMHDLWHIELVEKTMHKIVEAGGYQVDEEILALAAAFHGFVYLAEDEIRRWMEEQGYSRDMIDRVVTAAWESQRSEIPQTLEGKILHDAHVLEGGRQYLVVKTLITGSVRGQSLQETLKYMREHVLGKNECWLPETKPLCEEMNRYADAFYTELVAALD